MPEARWSDLAVAAAAADKPSSGSADPILTGPQAARRSAHKVHTILFAYPHPWGTPSLAPTPSCTPSQDHKEPDSLSEKYAS